MATDNIASIADLAEAYYAKLALLLDNYASVRNNVVTLRPRSPWFTSEIKEQKVKRRTLKRLWQKTRLTVAREELTRNNVQSFTGSFVRPKQAYYTDLISELESKPSELFGTQETLLKGRTEKLYPPCNASEDLANQYSLIIFNGR